MIGILNRGGISSIISPTFRSTANQIGFTTHLQIKNFFYKTPLKIYCQSQRFYCSIPTPSEEKFLFSILDHKKENSSSFQHWLVLRKKLWPHCDDQKHKMEMQQYLEDLKNKTVFFAKTNSTYIGFLEITIRCQAEGAYGKRIGYLEGIYVLPEYRNRKVAKHLILQAEEWARDQNCTAMASDTGIDNYVSIDVHKNLDYKEVSRLVHFIKDFLI